jgi:hypothetical protein
MTTAPDQTPDDRPDEDAQPDATAEVIRDLEPGETSTDDVRGGAARRQDAPPSIPW